MTAEQIAAIEFGKAPEIPEWLTRDELVARIRVPKSTAETWARLGKGPQFAKFGRHVRYRLSDVIAWENAQIGGGA